MVILHKFNKRIKEEAKGLKNSVNKVFTASSVFKTDSLIVLYNGQNMTKDIDFDIIGSNSFSFIYITPKQEDVLKIDYIKV